MSYYFKNRYHFTDHGIARIKKRLNLQNLNDWELSQYCSRLIDDSVEVIETKDFKYIKINHTSNSYFVVKKQNNLIITCSPINALKFLQILEE